MQLDYRIAVLTESQETTIYAWLSKLNMEFGNRYSPKHIWEKCKMRNKLFHIITNDFAYLHIPALVLIFSGGFLSSFPKIWAFYSDPSYAYLMNGLGLITGHPPNIIQHPGISMQLYIGFIILVTTILQGSNNFIDSVIDNPESYFNLILYINFFIFIVVFAILSHAIQKRYGFRSLIVFQLFFISSFSLFFPYILLAMPEFLVLISGIICLTIILNPRFANSPSKGMTAVLGLFMAVGIMSKVIFAPIILMIFIVIGIRNSAKVVTAFIFFIFLHFALIAGRVLEMFSWFLDSSKSLNRYDAESSYDVGLFLLNYQTAFSNLKSSLGVIFPLFLLVIPILILLLIRNRTTLSSRKILWGLLAAVGCSLMTGYKASTPRDFILLGVLIPIIVTIGFQEIQKPRFRKVIFPSLIIFMIPCITWNFQSTAQSMSTNISDSRLAESDALRVESVVGNSWLIGQYGLMTENAALQFGNNWAGSHFSKAISKRYPNSIEFNVWDFNFYYNNPQSGLEILTCESLTKLTGGRILFVLVLNLDLDKRLQKGQSFLNFSNGTEMMINEKWDFEKYVLFEISSVRCNNQID